MAGPLLSSEKTNFRRRLFFGVILFVAIALFIAGAAHYKRNYYGDVVFPNPQFNTEYTADLSVKQFVKPEGIKIIGLVFFGRRSRVEIMRCFLERNLVDNGGWFDEVQWVKNTAKKDDLAYLDEIIASSPRYKVLELDEVGFIGYGKAWKLLERGSLYIKIDDDVVWMADDTIPRIASMRIQNPEYLVVSANMINSPLMGWVQYHMGAMHPYLPEFDTYEAPLLNSITRKPWNYAAYPNWTGPADYFFDKDQDPPYDGHRWLRLPLESDIHRTPVSEIEYKTWGTALQSWAIAAQVHYSFLHNLADGTLDKYKMGKAWITDYKRLSINLIAVMADDVLDNLPMDTVDEEWLTVNLPRKLGRSVAVETDALAVHFTFGGQGKVEKTDLLPRYRDYALENACARRM